MGGSGRPRSWRRFEGACVPAYVRGLRDEGCDVPEEVVARGGHALLMLLFSGLSAVPFDLFEGPVDDRARCGSPPTGLRSPATRSTCSTVGARRPAPDRWRRTGVFEAGNVGTGLT